MKKSSHLLVSSASTPSSTQMENPACTCLPEAAVSLQSLQHGRQPSHRLHYNSSFDIVCVGVAFAEAGDPKVPITS
jgi:hypothetical protein